MNRPRIRTQIAFLLFILLPAATGVVAIHASAACQRFVKTYVTKPIRNTVSKQTLAAWAAWRAAHPNWRPNPNVHRPKYVMSRDEAVQKVNFACAVELIPSDASMFFPTAKLDPPPAVPELRGMDTAQISFPDVLPTEVAELTPVLPTIPPQTPLIAGTVPEPGSWLMVLSGLGSMLLLAGAKKLRPQD